MKILWVGDAVAPSGFSRCTHGIVDELHKLFDVSVLGINYHGDPHSYPYSIYPAAPGGDPFGVRRLSWMIGRLHPDVVILQNDVWNIPVYIKWMGEFHGKVVGFLAVDGKNCLGKSLADLDLAIFWTQFGLQEAVRGGYNGPAAVVPLGVDSRRFERRSRLESRRKLNLLPEELIGGFIVGNVNRNQPRKRLDLTIEYFAEWVNRYKIEDAYLFLHVAPTGDTGFDVKQLAHYYGILNRLILTEPSPNEGVDDDEMVDTYNSFDVLLNTSQNEGWHLPTMEAMSCGISTIGPDWAGSADWSRNTSLLIPCTSHAVTPGGMNSIGGVMNKEATISALDRLYHQPEYREELGGKGYELARQPQYYWPNIGKQFAEVLVNSLEPVHA